MLLFKVIHVTKDNKSLITVDYCSNPIDQADVATTDLNNSKYHLWLYGHSRKMSTFCDKNQRLIKQRA